MSNSKKLLIKVTGSIAAYKCADLVSKAKQLGYEVRVAASPSALKFVGAATFEGLCGHHVYSDTFAEGEMMSHIHLMRWADAILVCPATANYVNRISAGLGDDLLTTLFLAHSFDKPYLIAPAMNASMYNHPVTQESLRKLREMGISILEPTSGSLACGEVGPGRLLEPSEILSYLEDALNGEGASATKSILQKMENPRSSATKKILITSGGTKEAIDRVRHIGNGSTGRTGAKLSELLSEMGYDVTYVHATDAIKPRGEIRRIPFGNFVELDEALKTLLGSENFDAIIHAAAVSDFSISHLEDSAGKKVIETGKIASSQDLKVVLRPTHKIINSLRDYSQNKGIQVIGFKLTSHASENHVVTATTKVLTEAQANAVVHNDLSEIDLKNGRHPFHLYLAGRPDPVDCENVQSLAHQLYQLLDQGRAPVEQIWS